MVLDQALHGPGVQAVAPRAQEQRRRMQRVGVDLRAPASFPASLAELERFDFFVLSDVPADAVSFASQEVVERWLRETGGGFLFAGGPNGFGPGGWQRAPLARVLSEVKRLTGAG